MKRLKTALEDLDEEISTLQDRIGLQGNAHQTAIKKQADMVKQVQRREASVLAAAQKVAARLDQVVDHVEQVLRD